MRLFRRLILTFGLLYSVQSVVSAATLTVASSGMFSNSVAMTTWSAPNATWSFNFSVDDTPSVTNSDAAGFDVTFAGFSYSLAGAPVVTTPVRIRLFTTGSGGLLNVYFEDSGISDDNPITGFEFQDSQVFSGTTSAPTILTGTYTASTGSAFFSSGAPVQDLTGTQVTISGASQGVPEPGTWATTALAFGLLVAFGRRLRLT